jgi:hypothetical protein
MVVTEVCYVPLHTSERCCYGAQDTAARDERRMGTNELEQLCCCALCGWGAIACEIECAINLEIYNTRTHSLIAHPYAGRLGPNAQQRYESCWKRNITMATRALAHTMRTHRALQSTRSITSVGWQATAAVVVQFAN